MNPLNSSRVLKRQLLIFDESLFTHCCKLLAKFADWPRAREKRQEPKVKVVRREFIF